MALLSYNTFTSVFLSGLIGFPLSGSYMTKSVATEAVFHISSLIFPSIVIFPVIDSV